MKMYEAISLTDRANAQIVVWRRLAMLSHRVLRDAVLEIAHFVLYKLVQSLIIQTFKYTTTQSQLQNLCSCRIISKKLKLNYELMLSSATLALIQFAIAQTLLSSWE